MRKLLVLLLIVTSLFVSCNPAVNEPVGPGNDPTGPSVTPPSSDSGIVRGTTEGKFVVESTFQELSGKIREAIAKGKSSISLSNETLENGIEIEEGEIEISSYARSMSSDYSLSIEIKKAKDKNNGDKALTLSFESEFQLDGENITNIRPVKTEATIDGETVSDIDSETFVPVALTFANKTLLQNLAQVMKTAANMLSDKLGISLDQMEITVPEVGKVMIDCQKSALLSNGSGILVFNLVDIDNQWHTLALQGGVVTIDGWAEVGGEEDNEEIVVSETPVVKDDDIDITEDQERIISEYIAPRFYTVYYNATEMIVAPYWAGIYEFRDEMLKDVNMYAKSFFGDEESYESFSIELNQAAADMLDQGINNPTGGTAIVKAKAKSSVYGDIEMVLHMYAYSNNLTDYKIASFTINGVDYTYLGYEMLKSMLRVFTGVFYIQDASTYVIYEQNTLEEDESGNLVYTFNNNGGQGDQLLVKSGTVTLSVEDVDDKTKIVDYVFDDVVIFDNLGEVTYVLSGSGSSSGTEMSNNEEVLYYPYISFTVDSFHIEGVGYANEDDLEVINKLYELTLQDMVEQMPDTGY